MWKIGLSALLLAGCATRPLVIAPAAPAAIAPAATAAIDSERQALDAIARDYVPLTLEMGERDPGFVDAYYGPAEWQAAAKASPRTMTELAAAAGRLIERIDAQSPADPMLVRRAAFLRGQLVALQTRVRILSGEKMGFVEEARGLFGAAPVLRPLSDYDPILARLETLVPGKGPLATRVNAFADRFNIPADRLEPVMAAAIAECRQRTMARIALPPHERFTLALVKDKPWGGYNYYQGQAMSKIEINTDLPIRMPRAVDLGCHEGYPGHHVYNALLEEKLARGRGWIEFTVYPLYSPQSLIAEGSANYGIELAFPGDEQLAFETAVLYPLAGLPTADARRYREMGLATKGLTGVQYTIADEYLSGRIDRAAAAKLIERYQLATPERAEQTLKFLDTYRSYIVNYGFGLDLVRAHVEAAGSDPATRWARMERLLSEPTMPADLETAGTAR